MLTTYNDTARTVDRATAVLARVSARNARIMAATMHSDSRDAMPIGERAVRMANVWHGIPATLIERVGTDRADVSHSPDVLGNRATSGRPTRWSTQSPDSRALPQSDVKVTRSRKRGSSFVVSRREPHRITTGDVHYVDPTLDTGAAILLRDDRGDEPSLVAAADALLSRCEDYRSLRLTDRPWLNGAKGRMRPNVYGGRAYRGIHDYVWCETHESADCRCEDVRRASTCVLTHTRQSHGLDTASGGERSTTIADSWPERETIPAGTTRKPDAVTVLHEIKRDDGSVARRIYGRTHRATTLRYDAESHVAHVYDESSVTELLARGIGGWWIGHTFQPDTSKRDQSTRGKAQARANAQTAADRRDALSAEIMSALTSADASPSIIGTVTVGREPNKAGAFYVNEGGRIHRHRTPAAATAKALALIA